MVLVVDDDQRVVAFFEKPVKRDVFMAAVRKHARRKGMRGQSQGT